MAAADDAARQLAAAHAMQSGVAMEMNWNPSPTEPKHLRVVVRLLIKKGVITEAEYMKVIADEMEREAERYRDRIQQHFGGTARINLA